MFSNVIPSKKKDVKLEDDNILANILSELESNDNQNTSGVQNSETKSSAKATEKAEMKNFMADFAKGSKSESTIDDVSFESVSIHFFSPNDSFFLFFN